MGVAVALDQAAAADDLDAKIVVRREPTADGGEPRRDMRLLDLVAEQRAAEAAHAGERIERDEPEDAVGADVAALVEHAVDRPRELRARLDRAAEPRRHGAADLLDARVHELGDVDHLVVAGPRLVPHPGEAGGPRLQVGDADHVVIGHGAGEVLRRLAGQREAAAVAAAGAVERQQFAEPVEIEVAVSRILEVDDMAEAGARSSRCVSTGNAVATRATARSYSARSFAVPPTGFGSAFAGASGIACWRHFAQRHRLGPGGERREARRDALAAGADRRLEGFAGEGQRAGCGERAEQARRDDAAIGLGEALQVVGDEALRLRPRDRRDLFESAMPSPGAVFSRMPSARCEEAISVVRSGETRPRWMARPASISSAAMTMSTSPGAGIIDSTGVRPATAGIISR